MDVEILVGRQILVQERDGGNLDREVAGRGERTEDRTKIKTWRAVGFGGVIREREIKERCS